MADAQLIVKIGAELSEYKKGLQEATKATTSLSKDITGVGKSMTAKLTVPIAGVGAMAIKTGSDFQQSMANVKSITNATESEFAKLSEEAKRLGSTTRFSASEASDAMSYLGMAGWDTTEIIAGLSPVLDLASASGTDLAKTADIVSDALTGFGLTAQDTQMFTDVLAQVSRKANTNVEMLGESFKYVAPVAGSLGYSVQDTSVALGLMANAGIKGSQAGTALRGALTRMISPTDEARALMDKLGISMADAEGNMLPLGDVMGQLREKFAGLTDEQKSQYASTIFGTEAMSGMLAIIDASPDAYQDLTDAIANANGASKEMADIQNNTLQGSIAGLKSAVEGALISFFELGDGALKSVVDGLTKAVQWFNSLSPSVKQAIVVVGGLVASIGPLLIIFGSLMGSIVKIKAGFTLLNTSFGLATKASGLFKSALALLNPTTIAISAGIVALVAIGKYVYDNWETISASLKACWEALKQSATQCWENIKTVTSTMWQSITSFVSSAWDTIKSVVQVGVMLVGEIIKGAVTLITLPWQFIWQNCKDLLIPLWEGIKSAISTGIQFVVNVIKTHLETLKAFWSTVWNTIKTIASTVWEGIKSVVTTGANILKTVIMTILNGIKSVWSAVWGAISSVASTIWGNIRNTATTIFNGIKSNITNIINSLKSTITTVFNAIKNAISTPLNAVKNTVNTIFNGIKNTISNVINNAKSIVSNGMNAIKRAFNINISFPKIKLPHFKVSGKFSLNPPSVPSFGVEWYKTGGVFDGASVIGVGEAGPEAVVPLKGHRMKPFAETIAGMMPNGGEKSQDQVTLVVPVKLDGKEITKVIIQDIDEELNRRKKISSRFRGGK